MLQVKVHWHIGHSPSPVVHKALLLYQLSGLIREEDLHLSNVFEACQGVILVAELSEIQHHMLHQNR